LFQSIQEHSGRHDIVPIFLHKSSGPLTITHPDAPLLMTIPGGAARAVTAALGRGGGSARARREPIKITDLAMI
jgi:FlaA1/EpsC-like NDP-sugar epimerase